MHKISPAIVEGIVNSDLKSFRSLYDAYYAYLCGLAVSYIHDFEKAKAAFAEKYGHEPVVIPVVISDGARKLC